MFPTYVLKFNLNTIQVNEFNLAKNPVRWNYSKCIPISNRACSRITTHLQLGISGDQPVEILGAPRLFNLFQKDCPTLLMSINRNLKYTRAIDVIPMMMCIDNATNIWKVSTFYGIPYLFNYAWAISRIDKGCPMATGNDPNRGLHMEWICRVRPKPHTVRKLNKFLFHFYNYIVKATLLIV